MKKHPIVIGRHPLILPPQPMMPHVIQIPGLAVMEPKPIIDPDILKFLDESQDGIIASIIPNGIVIGLHVYRSGTMGGSKIATL